VRFLAHDGLVRKRDEVADVSSHQTSAIARGVKQLLPIRSLTISNLGSGDSIVSLPSEPLGDVVGQVGVEVELHALCTASEAWVWMPSRYNASFSAIASSTSSGYFS